MKNIFNAIADFFKPKPMMIADIDPPRLRGIFTLCSQTGAGAALVDIVLQKRIPLALEDLSGGTLGAFISDTFSGTIKLDEPADDATLAKTLFHESRHAEQSLAGCLNPKHYTTVMDAIWHLFMIEADAEATAVVLSLKTKIAGDDSLFDAGRATPYAPMYKKAEALYDENPASIDTPEFKRHVFDQWFTLTHIRNHYARKFFATIEQHGTPQHYAAQKPCALTEADITPIAQCGGESENYLTLPGFRALDSAYYCKVKDEELESRIEMFDLSIKRAMQPKKAAQKKLSS